MPRSTHASTVAGSVYDDATTSRVLVIGAGGIGCELVKNIVLSGFKDITLLDLDTIDLSNLNRQFLFRKRDVKQPKATIAARTVSAFNPSSVVTPIHGNIKEPQFDVTWFKSFRIVLNALDNIDARRHVNKMCAAAGVPLIESGTAGYLGQVQPIIKDVTECFDCIPKAVPKSFPVCTIRSTPSTPIHCIVWAKSYLFPELFGEQDEDLNDLKEAAAAGEDATELENLRKEALAFRALRASFLSSEDESAPATVFNKIFSADIRRLLTMHDMWRFRRPPTPLDRDSILSASNGATPSEPLPPQTNGDARGKLKDQRELSLKDNVLLFESSVRNLATRARAGSLLLFDKDDDDALDFVTAAANLRAYAYGIPTLTRWSVKEMAGNIIPAIATTNAIIAGLIVLQALNVLRAYPRVAPTDNTNEEARIRSSLRGPYIQLESNRLLIPASVAPPNPRCSVCRETYLHIRCDPERVTLGQLTQAVLAAEVLITGKEREVAIFEGARLLADPDFDDNLDRTLSDMGCGQGTFITLVDEEKEYENVSLAISPLPDSHPSEAIPYIIPADLQVPRKRVPLPPPSPPGSPLKQLASPTKPRPGKRSRDDDDLLSPAPQPSNKRAKTAEPDDDDVVMLGVMPAAKEPSAKEREAIALRDEGLVIIE